MEMSELGESKSDSDAIRRFHKNIDKDFMKKPLSIDRIAQSIRGIFKPSTGSAETPPGLYHPGVKKINK